MKTGLNQTAVSTPIGGATQAAPQTQPQATPGFGIGKAVSDRINIQGKHPTERIPMLGEKIAAAFTLDDDPASKSELKTLAWALPELSGAVVPLRPSEAVFLLTDAYATVREAMQGTSAEALKAIKLDVPAFSKALNDQIKISQRYKDSSHTNRLTELSSRLQQAQPQNLYDVLSVVDITLQGWVGQRLEGLRHDEMSWYKQGDTLQDVYMLLNGTHDKLEGGGIVIPPNGLLAHLSAVKDELLLRELTLEERSSKVTWRNLFSLEALSVAGSIAMIAGVLHGFMGGGGNNNSNSSNNS